MTLHLLKWKERATPLPISGVLAQGAVGVALVHRLAEDVHANVGTVFRMAASQTTVVAIGDEANLPWIDGAVWLGEDRGISCPTTIEPSLHPALVASAVQYQARSVGQVICAPNLAFVLAGTTTSPDRPALLRIAQSLQVAQ